MVFLFLGVKRFPEPGRPFGVGMRELRKEAARSGDEDDAKQRLLNNEDGKEIALNAGKGEGSV